MPNENRVQNNFYRCKKKIFLPYPNKRCSLFDNWFLKAGKNLSNNLSGNTPRQLKMLPIFGFEFYMSYSQATRLNLSEYDVVTHH